MYTWPPHPVEPPALVQEVQLPAIGPVEDSLLENAALVHLGAQPVKGKRPRAAQGRGSGSATNVKKSTRWNHKVGGGHSISQYRI